MYKGEKIAGLRKDTKDTKYTKQKHICLIFGAKIEKKVIGML